MYQVLKITRSVATNSVDLLNLNTETKDLNCFDDSGLKGLENFDFMEEENIYDCKLLLFGEFEKNSTGLGIEVTIIDKDVMVGNRKCFRVLIDSDVYYILESDAKDIEVKEKMHYTFSRKDIVQVENVVHPVFLR